MRRPLSLLLCIVAVVPALAHDLGIVAPTKLPHEFAAPAPDPAVLRQGGDTIADAVVIDIPYVGSGTTVGYTNDYDEICPYGGSTSPDVVFRVVPSASWLCAIDLWGSSYDTKVYVYDQALNLLACNDDYYSDYTSYLEIPLAAGAEYYLVVDGYGGDAGAYQLAVHEIMIEVLECPPGGIAEGEPPLADGYLDAWNGGCNSPEFGNPFQPLPGPILCGRSGWYHAADGTSMRDTDWFTTVLPPGGVLTVSIVAEQPVDLFELGPHDCGTVGVLQNVEALAFEVVEMTVSGTPGDEVWLWVGPTVFVPPYGYPAEEFDYVLELPGVVAVQPRSWTGVKALFD